MNDPQPQQPTLGKLIDEMLAIRDVRSDLAKQDKGLKERFDELELAVMQKLNDEDTIQGKSKKATATISSIVVPSIKNWEDFEEYIYENRALYMLEKRPSGATFRELLAQGEEIPGLEPITKSTISLRRL